jgi:hypothetical protein
LGVKSLIAATALLFAFVTGSSAVVWTAAEDKAGQFNVVGYSAEGELRIVIKGRDVKVYAFLKALDRESAASLQVSTVLGAKKGKTQWTASADASQPGTLLEAPNGTVLLDELFQAGASTFSLRIAPPGKLSVVADFSLSGLEDYKARILEAQTKPPVPVKVVAKAR